MLLDRCGSQRHFAFESGRIEPPQGAMRVAVSANVKALQPNLCDFGPAHQVELWNGDPGIPVFPVIGSSDARWNYKYSRGRCVSQQYRRCGRRKVGKPVVE